MDHTSIMQEDDSFVNAQDHKSELHQKQNSKPRQEESGPNGPSPEIDSPPTTPGTINTTAKANGISSAAVESFYDNLELEIEAPPTPSPSHTPSPLDSAPSSATDRNTDSSPTSATATAGSKIGSKKIRVNPGSNISRRITMLASGKNENGSDEHTADHTKAPSSGQTTPDPSDYPDSFFEELLREDQTTLSRSFTTMPKSASTTPRSSMLASKPSMPIRLPSQASSGSNGDAASDTGFVSTGDLEEDLKKLQTELTKTKDTKAKAEAEAKAQRVTVMSLKTEVQLVRNVLKRRETELGDVKDMSAIYESELSELRQKLEKAERQLSKGQGEMAAKVRALERMRDESVARIQTLDQEIMKLRTQLEETEKKNEVAQSEILGLKSELEELAPFREAASEQRELNSQEPEKVKELSLQITDLEDTRDIQAALIEELESKITTVEAEALEFKGKAELEYEALSDGFKVLKTRRSEEINVLKAELEQHKLQEQIIERLQADIDQLQSALALVANSQSTENARINQVTAELNEALALKDQEVIEVRQSMTEFEESHNRLVSSLQVTLTTINEEADSARKSRDEAVTALESLREELEALRHSLPINNKHMSLSQWSAEQQQLQQEQLKAIRELEEKLDGQVVGAKEDQQRAGILEANTKRRSQQLTLDMAHHLHLSNTMVHNQSTTPSSESDKEKSSAKNGIQTPSQEEVLDKGKDTEMASGTVSVRTMLKFLSQLQGRNSSDLAKGTHVREGTEATVIGDTEPDYESQLRVYLLGLNDASLMEPWTKEKKLEDEIDQLEQKIQSLLSDLTVANQKHSEVEDALKNEQLSNGSQSLNSKEQELMMKESMLREKELALQVKEQELAEAQGRADSFPLTPPFSAPITPFGSPGNADLFPSIMATHQRSVAQDSDDDKDEAELVTEEGKRHQVEVTAQQIKLIKSLEEKVAELEKRASLPILDEHQLQSSFPPPPTSITLRHSQSGTLSRINSQTLRTSLLSGPPDTPPPTIALPPIPISSDSNTNPRSSVSSPDEILSPRKKSGLCPTTPTDSPANKAAAAAATEAAVAAALAKSQEAQKELVEQLKRSEAELNKARSMNKELETELSTALQGSKQGLSLEQETQKLKQENTELAQVLEEIRKSLDQAQNQARGLESVKTQLEAQVQKERQAKDEAVRLQDRLQTQLEEALQKKKGFLCF